MGEPWGRKIVALSVWHVKRWLRTVSQLVPHSWLTSLGLLQRNLHINPWILNIPLVFEKVLDLNSYLFIFIWKDLRVLRVISENHVGLQRYAFFEEASAEFLNRCLGVLRWLLRESFWSVCRHQTWGDEHVVHQAWRAGRQHLLCISLILLSHSQPTLRPLSLILRGLDLPGLAQVTKALVLRIAFKINLCFFLRIHVLTEKNLLVELSAYHFSGRCSFFR